MPLGLSGSGLITGFDPTASGFGKVLQVVSATTTTAVVTTSTSFVTSNLTASIKPSNSSNKIAIMAYQPIRNTSTTEVANATLFRGSVAGTNLGNATNGMQQIWTQAGNIYTILSIVYLDSPNTTSNQTYTVGIRASAATTTVTTCAGDVPGTILLIEVAA